jgi:hypothetical protein
MECVGYPRLGELESGERGCTLLEADGGWDLAGQKVAYLLVTGLYSRKDLRFWTWLDSAKAHNRVKPSRR